MVAELNAVRAANGAPPLQYSPTLTASSLAYSRRMIRKNYFGHASRIRAGGDFTKLGEVLELHRGRKALIRRAVRSWLASSAHRAVILNPAFAHVGAGRAYGRFGRHLVTTWVVQVGRL